MALIYNVLFWFSILYADACPESCRVCTSDGICREFENGWFGEKCDKKCVASARICSYCRFNVLVNEAICLNCQKGQYQSMGKCWDCFIFCSSCFDYLICTKCKEGHYGSDCFHQCPEHCVECSSPNSCTSCNEGWTGRSCQCNQNCVQKGNISNWCGVNGTCLKGCINGYYGTYCDQECNEYCLNSKTKLNKCDDTSGHCRHGCASGRYGDVCEYNCSETCQGVLCDRKAAQCLSGSENNYHPKVYTVAGCIAGSLLLLCCVFSVWCIKREVSGGKCFRRKPDSEVSMPVTSEPFYNEAAENLDNTVEIYHMVVDNDPANEIGTSSNSHDYYEVHSDPEDETRNTVTVVGRSYSGHHVLYRNVSTSATYDKDTNDISMTICETSVSRSGKLRRHLCDNCGSLVTTEENDILHTTEKPYMTESKQYPQTGILDRSRAFSKTKFQRFEEINDDSTYAFSVTNKSDEFEDGDEKVSNSCMEGFYTNDTFQAETIGTQNGHTGNGHSIMKNAATAGDSYIMYNNAMMSDTGVSVSKTNHEDWTEIQGEIEQLDEDGNAVYLHPV